MQVQVWVSEGGASEPTLSPASSLAESALAMFYYPCHAKLRNPFGRMACCATHCLALRFVQPRRARVEEVSGVVG